MNSRHSQNDNTKWYFDKSKAKNLPLHCPIAAPYLCLRFLITIDLSVEVGLCRGINLESKERYYRYWRKQLHKFINLEAEPAVSFINDEPFNMSNFCPEVSYLIFGYFASHVVRYTNEIDQNAMHQFLKRKMAGKGDWRWYYSNVVERHYTECPEFSISWGINKPSKNKSRIPPSVRWKVFARDNFTCQYCGSKPPDVQLEIDHVMPLSKDGDNNEDNLITSCKKCNIGKGSKVKAL